MNRKSFFERQRLGVILRTFAKDVNDAYRRLEAVVAAMETLLTLQVRVPEMHIDRIDVMVATDDRYPDCDRGGMGALLRKKVASVRTHVHDDVKGDLFCGLLNHGVALQCRDRIDWSLVLSTEAASYADLQTVEAMVDAACHGARAVGVAIGELEQSVLEGRLANTFCMWHTVSLLSVGGFDCHASQIRTDDRLAGYLRGWDQEKGEVFYPRHGVEEIIPLARMVETYGPCIAPILPQGDGAQRYEVPDPKSQPQQYARHVKKMGTKTERQMAHLAQLGYDLSWLKGGVMEQYRRL